METREGVSGVSGEGVTGSVDAQIAELEAKRKELLAADEAAKKEQAARDSDRAKADLRVSLADAVRSLDREGSRFMQSRVALLEAFKAAVAGEAISAAEAEKMRADLKLTEG